MANVVSMVGRQLDQKQLEPHLLEAAALLSSLVPSDAYVGEVYSLGYDEALVQIHDSIDARSGGIPALSFLIATRIPPDSRSTSARRTPRSSCCACWTTPTCRTPRRRCASGSITRSGSAGKWTRPGTTAT